MMRVLLHVYHVPAYFLSFFLFGTFGLGLSLFCFCLGWLPDSPETERFFQRLLHRHFVLWFWWLSFARLIYVRFDDFTRLSLNRGCVIVANHPGLMDITYLLARLPEALCVFKPAIRHNPVLGAAARRAGYLAADGGHDLLRTAAEKVAAGHTLIVFPEGSRSPAGALRPFKPGFVVIARRARAPIQLVRITCDPPLLVKGCSWWKIPRFPAYVTVTLGPCLPPPDGEKTAALAASVEAWFRTASGDTSAGPVSPLWQPAA
jgi:1-acyl-sn-glycerol-3-phosphate acyltransferase